MFVPFESLSPTARIWIYQSDRPFNTQEEDFIMQNGEKFMNEWAAHGQPLRASISTRHSHFVVVAVNNEAQLPTGCSIDQSVGFVRAMEEKLQIGFFNRTKVSVWSNNSVLLKDLAVIKKEIQEGILAEDTLVFNNMIQSKGELDRWIVPIKSSWLSRYFIQTAGNLES